MSEIIVVVCGVSSVAASAVALTGICCKNPPSFSGIHQSVLRIPLIGSLLLLISGQN